MYCKLLWDISHWALGKLNSMGSWCTKLSYYMGGWCLRKLNSMGGWVKKSAVFLSPWTSYDNLIYNKSVSMAKNSAK